MIVEQAFINDLRGESPTAKRHFGDALEDFVVQANITNFASFPVEFAEAQKHYWCVLTRFDTFSIAHQDRSFDLQSNRQTGERNDGDYATIAEIVTDGLGTAKPSENAAVEPSNLD